MPILFAFLVGILAVAGFVFWLLTMIGWTTALSVYFIATCVLLILVVLIQKPKGGGLAGAFGGAGGGQQAVFGAKAGDMFTLVTVCLFLLFLLLGMGLVYSTRLDDARAEDLPDPGAVVEPDDPAKAQIPSLPPGDDPKKKDDGVGLITGDDAKKTDGDKAAPKTDDAKKPAEDGKKTGSDATPAPPKGSDR